MTISAIGDELPSWVQVFVVVFERIGTGAAVLIFLGAVVWKVLPPLTKLLRAWKTQADKITDALPRFEADFRSLVHNVQTGFVNMERKLDATFSTPCPLVTAGPGAPVRPGGNDPGSGGDRGPGLSLTPRHKDP